MQQKVVREIEALERMSVPELRDKYREVIGEEATETGGQVYKIFLISA